MNDKNNKSKSLFRKAIVITHKIYGHNAHSKTRDVHTTINKNHFLPVNADLASPSSLNCICPFRASSDNDDIVCDPYVAACMIVDNNSSVCTISLLVDEEVDDC